nr:unnamed protein product [Callosobruchus analis]
MSAISDITSEVEVRKVSILTQCSREEIEQKCEVAPVDRFGLVKITILFYSLGTFLPLSFFITANDYWMYKFRDPQYPTADPNHRTSLQAYFASSVSICRAIPSLTVTMAVMRYGHKIHLRTRMLWTLGIMVAAFVALNMFVLVPTDGWQLGFFVIAMALIIVVTGCLTILAMSQTVLTARLPSKYIKWHLYGQGAQGVFSAVLQIICLAIGNNSTQVAMLYFGCGTAVILFTFILAVISERLPFYTYYLGDTTKDTERPVHTLKQIKAAASKTWQPLAVLAVLMIFLPSGHPNITSLVVSEYYGHDKYFVPVVTFLFSELVSLAARCLARPIVTVTYIFCNSYSNAARHLPILFPHDWEYIIIIILDNLTTHLTITSTITSIPRLTDSKETAEIVFILMTSLMGILSSLTSPLSPLWVKLL